VESEQAGWLAAHGSVPEVEVHVERDATWMIQPGAVWSNAVVRLRFGGGTVERRLDRVLKRYRATGRGVGFWVSPFATPEDVSARLRMRGLRCRKHYPAMYCDLRALARDVTRPGNLTIEVVEDYDIFATFPHPYFGDVQTPLRRFELARLAHLNQLRPRRVWDLVALRHGVPIGACTLFFDGTVVGFHDVGVRGAPVGRASALPWSAAPVSLPAEGAHSVRS
jgi:hypothetical protein